MAIIFSTLVHLSLDGVAMLMLLGELLIVLFFLITALSVNVQSIQIKLPRLAFIAYILVGLAVSLNFKSIVPFWANYCDLYETYSAILFNDFYLFYAYFFQENPSIIIFITCILSIFSIFFIMYFYTLRGIKNKVLQKTHNIDILRKQQLLKQEAYNPKLRIFKK
jgi:hypothetical protein